MRTLAYDFTLMRPGCAIVQRVFGATITNEDLHCLDDWITHPTDGMRLYPVTDEQMERLVELNNTKE